MTAEDKSLMCLRSCCMFCNAQHRSWEGEKCRFSKMLSLSGFFGCPRHHSPLQQESCESLADIQCPSVERLGLNYLRLEVV